MRLILVLLAVIIICVLVGWISFNKEPGRATVNIETQEIKEDTNKAMQAGSDLLHRAADDVKPEPSSTDDAPPNAPTQETSPAETAPVR